jgi:hypothetical protein
VDFPTSRELDRCGRSDLRRAVADYGGAAYWAARIDLPLISGSHDKRYGLEQAAMDARAIQRQLGALPPPDELRKLGWNHLAPLRAIAPVTPSAQQTTAPAATCLMRRLATTAGAPFLGVLGVLADAVERVA